MKPNKAVENYSLSTKIKLISTAITSLLCINVAVAQLNIIESKSCKEQGKSDTEFSWIYYIDTITQEKYIKHSFANMELKEPNLFNDQNITYLTGVAYIDKNGQPINWQLHALNVGSGMYEMKLGEVKTNLICKDDENPDCLVASYSILEAPPIDIQDSPVRKPKPKPKTLEEIKRNTPTTGSRDLVEEAEGTFSLCTLDAEDRCSVDNQYIPPKPHKKNMPKCSPLNFRYGMGGK